MWTYIKTRPVFCAFLWTFIVTMATIVPASFALYNHNRIYVVGPNKLYGLDGSATYTISGDKFIYGSENLIKWVVLDRPKEFIITIYQNVLTWSYTGIDVEQPEYYFQLRAEYEKLNSDNFPITIIND